MTNASLDDLTGPDGGLLAAAHRRLVDEGTPPAAAAMYLAGWFAGGLAGVVGRELAVASVGLEVDPARVRWAVHPDGWPEHIDLGDPPRLAGALEDLLDPTVAALVVAAEPIVEACHGLAAVGRAGLWNEVGDGLGCALADEDGLEVTPAMLAVLDAAVRAPAARWRARPSLRFAPSTLGPLHVVQKGGCCLAYTRPHWPDPPPELLGPAERAYRDRFPPHPGERHYCSTCSFRDAADADARQVCWRELVSAERAAAT
jgi:hypothetical protein